MSNFVFVHGGMVGGTSWKKVRKLLEEKNNVLTPTLTGLAERKHLSHPNIDLETHIQDILNTIYYEELGDIVLVGHSYGGMVITALADRIPEKIKKLVYVAAVLPRMVRACLTQLDLKFLLFFITAQKKEMVGRYLLVCQRVMELEI